MWPPKLPQMPPLFGDLFRAIIERLDAILPKDGIGIKVADAAGGGKSINSIGRSGSGGAGLEIRNLILVSAADKDHESRFRVTWGKVNDMQPRQMTGGDRIPCYFNAGGTGFVYTKATADLIKRQWVDAEIIQSGSMISNTKTVTYTLLGSYSFNDNALFVASWEGGDVVNNLCGLSA